MDVAKTIQSIQRGLDPYIKPRDQVSYIRRVLALNLENYLGHGRSEGPLSLVESSDSFSANNDSRGLQRDYLRALAANISAKKELERARQQHVAAVSSPHSSPNAPEDHVEDQIAKVKLDQKRQKLSVVQKYLDELGRQPAAALDFMDLGEVFAESPSLPEVPQEVVQGFALDHGSAKTDLKSRVGELEKVALRAKLLLQREEQLLQDVKDRTEGALEQITGDAKLQALNTTRAELINWIETELGKASPDGAEDVDKDEENDVTVTLKGGHVEHATPEITKKLETIKDKYAQYVHARKSLINLLRRSPQLSPQPPVELAAPAHLPSSPPGTTTYLLTPYLESLLAVSREQKSLILQKSHFNITLAKQMKETCQMLDHLAEESQLLPAFPMPGASRAKFGLIDGLGGGASERPDTSGRVRAWVFAADAAKMATLEAVAEKLEDGQVALEGSMKALHDIDQLLGNNIAEEKVEETNEDDIWLNAGPARKRAGARKHVDKKDKSSKVGDVWSAVEGHLGLSSQEGPG